MVDLAASVWRDFVTDGVPASGTNKPQKSKIRQWGAWLEGIVTAFTSNGGLIYSSLAAMNADLLHGANSSAWVVGDATVANNGIYKKIGASGAGSWGRVADLPYSFIRATDAGAGTPNAIVATTSIPLPANDGATLIALNIFENNTSSPATVVFNGGSPLTIKTNNGNDVQADYLVAGAIVAGYVSGSTFRLISDVASAADRAAAEAAASDASASASAAAASAAAIDYLAVADRTALKAVNTSAHTAALVKEAGRQGIFVWTTGDFSTQIAADTAEGIYIKANAIAATAGAWVRVFSGPWRLEWFGGVADGTTTNTAAFNAAIGLMGASGGAIELLSGTYVFATAPSSITKPLTLRGQGNPQTLISLSFATGDFLSVTSGICNISYLKITASVTRTSGYFIKVDTIRANIHHCYFEKPYKAVGLTSNCTLSRISHCEIRNITPHATAFGSGGIDVGDMATSANPDSCIISFVTIGNDTSNHHYAGIHIFSATALTLVGCDILQGNFSVLVDVATGCGVLNLKIDACYLDSATTAGLYMTAAGTGNIARVMATGSWFSTAGQGDGVTMAAIGTGVASGVSIVHCEAAVNAGAGVKVADAKWKFLSVVDCRIAQNTVAGVSLVANAGDANIQNNTIGAIDGLTLNGIGVSIAAGTGTRILVQNNKLAGNTIAVSNSATGTANRIEGNEGYNPVGLTAAATMGASPVTITAGPSPETHYVRQSATNTATITKGGQQVATLAGASTYYTIDLGPNESYVVTWTTTAPTYTKDVH